MNSEPSSAVPWPERSLERALQLFAAAGDDPAAQRRLLGEHPELRDWLEPMLDTAAFATASADERVLGDYRLISELGRGGMGIVYAAWQRSLSRRVAIKVLAPGLIASPTALARFRREAAAAGRLRHPGIVEVFDCGSVDGEHFFVMELVDGQPLHHCADRFATLDGAVRLVLQVVEALAHAHAAGLVHRDVKPANILVRADGRAALTDFGLASDSALPSLTREGGFLGTLDYAAPEQVRGEPVDVRADLFSAGVVLAELLAGTHPFRGPTQVATTARLLSHEPEVRDRRGARLPKDLAAIVDRALAKERSHRYATAEALAADLRAFVAGAPVSVRLPSRFERWWRMARRNPWRAALVVVLLTGVPALATLGGFLLAKAPAIAAGEATLVSQRREVRLAEAWLAFGGEDYHGTVARLGGAESEDGEARLLLSLALLRLGRRDEAAAALDGQQGPACDIVRLFFARTYEADAAESSARKAGDDAMAWFALGMHAYTRGLAEDDREALAQARHAADHAIALAASPRLSFLMTYGYAAARLGDAVGAGRAKLAMQKHFAHLTVAEVLVATIDAHLGGPEAIAKFEALTVKWPEDAGHHYTLGVLYERANRHADAQVAYQRAVELAPAVAPAWNNLGRMLRRRGDLPAAIAAYRRALAVAPEHVRAWNNLGNALLANGDAAGARAAFERAIEVRPGYGRAHYNLAVLLHKQGDLAGALPCYRRGVELEPDYAQGHNNLALVLWLTGARPLAMPAFQRAVELAPKDVRFLTNLAGFGFLFGDAEVSRRAARDLVALQPTDPRARLLMVLTRLMEPGSDLDGAVADMAALVDLHPAAALLALAEAHLAAARGDRAAALRALDSCDATADRAPWELEYAQQLRARLAR
ncbi:MAG: tetratricopeptide repeat protein [Planctomycetes bacterium]|nr:tetratricopeptide repeat protein [Planctomycetota bacterium]